MEAYKTKLFANWATGEGLANGAVETERGLIDAHLGGQVVKERVQCRVAVSAEVRGCSLRSNRARRPSSFSASRRAHAQTFVTRNSRH